MTFEIRPRAADDDAWVRALLEIRWGGEEIVVRGRRHLPADLPGFVAWLGDARVGLVTQRRVDATTAEVMSLDSLREREGIGSALLEAAAGRAAGEGARYLALITTNDNLRALGFYQRRGFRLRALWPGAVDEARLRKPSIPEVGESGIPLHDELELVRELAAAPGQRSP